MNRACLFSFKTIENNTFSKQKLKQLKESIWQVPWPGVRAPESETRS